jgi:hypothetical protein
VTVALVAGLAAAPMSGCAALRVDSGGPVTPSANAVEQARQRQALGAVRVREAVDAALDAAHSRELVADLADVRSAAAKHLVELGGVWVPFPSQSPTVPTPSDVPEVTSAATGTAADDATDAAPLVHVLTEESGSALADAQTVTDARLARLFASIAVARRLQAERLASSAGLEAPPWPTPTPPTAIPTGLSATALDPAIASEDAIGLAWEVVAARSSGAARTAATTRAAAHRERARTWAEVTGVAGTGLDPRRVSYSLPNAILDPTVDTAARDTALAGLEADLSALWLGLASTSAPGARAPLVDAFADAARTAADLSGTIPVLPGMPDIG